ncbi:MAG: 30S ribosomal protein S17, partial [Planctomycetota bacterium]|nr:30S ribosomal protein S17 [Planctomycetota bacterium]
MPEKSPRRVGIVESDARDKTRKVVVQWAVRHPKYGKYVRQRTVL